MQMRCTVGFAKISRLVAIAEDNGMRTKYCGNVGERKLLATG